MISILIVIIIILILIIFYKTTSKEVVYVKSDIDGEEYLVRDVEDKQRAANMLARIKKNIMELTDHLVKNIDKYEKRRDDINQLSSRIRNVIINESDGNSEYTSYSVNKGEQIVFCLRSKHGGVLHDLNLVMYVALHEIAHVACKEYGHTELFKEIFAFLTKIAIKLGMYRKVPFNETPLEYCGLIISESII